MTNPKPTPPEQVITDHDPNPPTIRTEQHSLGECIDERDLANPTEWGNLHTDNT